METTVKQRLIEYLKVKKIGQNKFEKLAGMSNGYIHHLKHAPKSSILTKILLSAPDLNKVWLLTGEGEMLTASDDVKPAKLGDPGMVTENKHGDIYYKDKAGQLYVDVPLVPCNAIGSLPSDLEEVSMDRPEWGRVRFRVDRIGHGKYYAFEVDGDSMDDGRRDSFERGDVVLVRELDRDDWMPRLYINKCPPQDHGRRRRDRQACHVAHGQAHGWLDMAQCWHTYRRGG